MGLLQLALHPGQVIELVSLRGTDMLVPGHVLTWQRLCSFNQWVITLVVGIRTLAAIQQSIYAVKYPPVS